MKFETDDDCPALRRLFAQRAHLIGICANGLQLTPEARQEMWEALRASTEAIGAVRAARACARSLE